MKASDGVYLVRISSVQNLNHENLARSATKAYRVDQEDHRRTNHRFSHTFNIRDQVLVARGKANLVWPPFKSRYYGPRRVSQARHPRYDQFAKTHRRNRKPVHARSLDLYHLKDELPYPNPTMTLTEPDILVGVEIGEGGSPLTVMPLMFDYNIYDLD